MEIDNRDTDSAVNDNESVVDDYHSIDSPAHVRVLLCIISYDTQTTTNETQTEVIHHHAVTQVNILLETSNKCKCHIYYINRLV